MLFKNHDLFDVYTFPDWKSYETCGHIEKASDALHYFEDRYDNPLITCDHCGNVILNTSYDTSTGIDDIMYEEDIDDEVESEVRDEYTNFFDDDDDESDQYSFEGEEYVEYEEVEHSEYEEIEL